jgi:hypothetical protein
MSRADLLATFFVHDDDGWRIKKHAHAAFYRWMASWGMSIRKPSDLGYDDDGFILPELTIIPEFVPTEYCPPDQLMFTGLKGIQDGAGVRRETMGARVNRVAEMVNDNGEQWIIWCGLNSEQDLAHELIPDSVSVFGALSQDQKIAAIEGFQDGTYRVLITKPSIAGFGMNFQNAHHMAFVGLSDSLKLLPVRAACWRIGQHHPVDATSFFLMLRKRYTKT